VTEWSPITRQYSRFVGEFVVSLAFARSRTILVDWRATVDETGHYSFAVALVEYFGMLANESAGMCTWGRLQLAELTGPFHGLNRISDASRIFLLESLAQISRRHAVLTL
jgi:hypothetical protein